MSFTTLKMHDKHEKLRVQKDLFFDLPMSLLIVGKSQSGKTNIIGNLLLRPYDKTDISGKSSYNHDFSGRNIYVVCPSIDLDQRWYNIIRYKNIPEGNIYKHCDERELTQLYDRLENDFHEAEAAGRTPEQVLIILDDCSFPDALKDMYGILTRIVCNGRHVCVNMIITAEKYSQWRSAQLTGAVFFKCSNNQLDLIMEDHCKIPKRDFIKMFRTATDQKHTFMVVNYSNPSNKRYLNHQFEPLL